MKKVCSYALSFCLLLGLLFYPSMDAKAASVSLGVSASTINIGDTVTVTVSVPDNISATVDLSFTSGVLSFVSASADVGTNGSTITMNIGKYSLAASTSVSVTFKAETSGAANISASVISAVDNDTAEEVSLDGASTSITVQNQTPDTPDDPDDGEDDEPELSADNSLSTLKLSSGTLSPSFQYSVTNYTATVGYNVTSVVVSATTSNEKATIESVTGNGNVSLSVGENVIQIVVKAENGVKATYTITVTRLSEDEDTTDPTETESESTEDTSDENVLQWNGQVLQPADEVPEEVVPADFTVNTVVINSVEMPCLTFANGDLKVLYLANEEGTEGLYVYDEVQQIVYPFVKIASEKNYVMVLLPDAANAPAPENYSACTLSIEGKGIINAYQFIQPAATTETTSWFGAETFYAAEPVATDFYLIYCMNNAGEKGWYVYDSVEGTFQRYLGSVHTPAGGTEGTTPGTPGPTGSVTDPNQLTQELENAKKMQLLIICVAAFVIIVLIVIIVNLALKNRTDEDDEYYDDEDDEYYDDDEYEFEEDVDTTDGVEDLNEDDEIEIEFYEMPEEAVEDTVKETAEDDEIEIEFYEMTEEEKENSEAVDQNDDEVEVEFYNMEELLMKEAITDEPKSEKEVISEKKSPEKKKSVVSKPVIVENAYTDDDEDDDLEFIELD